MEQGLQLSHESFLVMAAEAGVDAGGSHGDDLFRFVLATRATLETMAHIDVGGAEPDMAFVSPGVTLNLTG